MEAEEKLKEHHDLLESIVAERTAELTRLNEQLQEEIEERVFDALGEVKLPKSKRLFGAYSTQLSRGMAQRAMLAAALTKAPRLLIADEPTTALDVTIQAQILDLMRNLRTQMDTSIILITHDLATVAQICTRVLVMYAGLVVEECPTRSLFQAPLHPYTRGLLGCLPSVDKPRDVLAVLERDPAWIEAPE